MTSSTARGEFALPASCGNDVALERAPIAHTSLGANAEDALFNIDSHSGVLMFNNGPFMIDSVNASEMSTDRFIDQYFAREIPVVVRGVGALWPARTKWTADA